MKSALGKPDFVFMKQGLQPHALLNEGGPALRKFIFQAEGKVLAAIMTPGA